MNTTTIDAPVVPAEPTPHSSAVEVRGSDLHLTAETPMEMKECNAALIGWCAEKIKRTEVEVAELQENLDLAVKNKWRTQTLRKHVGLARQRFRFYTKIKAALESGYCIVPNFPTTAFAIRTDEDGPTSKRMVAYHYRKPQYTHEEYAKDLPAGEGQYHSNFPYVWEHSLGKVKMPNGEEKEKWSSEALSFDDVNFPVNMAKPRIMEATSRAMLLKIFDEIGILPDPLPRKDPVIVGRIYQGQGRKWNRRANKHVSFIIAWHLNTEVL